MAPDERREYALVVYTVPERWCLGDGLEGFLDPIQIYTVRELVFVLPPAWDTDTQCVYVHRSVSPGFNRPRWRFKTTSTSVIGRDAVAIQEWVARRVWLHSLASYVLLGRPFLIELTTAEATALRVKKKMPRSVAIRMTKARRAANVPVMAWEIGGTPADVAPTNEVTAPEAAPDVIRAAAGSLWAVANRTDSARWPLSAAGHCEVPAAGRARSPRRDGTVMETT